MSREKRGKDGLTHRERKFAQAMCTGMRPKDAYAAAGLAGRRPVPHGDGSASSHAYVKARQPHIVAWMNEWLDRARISDVDSPGRAVSTTLQAINEATDDRNWTAIAALQRLRYQHNGIAERTQISLEAVISDADLLRRVAGDNQDKVGLLTTLLRPGTFSPGSSGAPAAPVLVIEHQPADDEDQQ